ncbi:transposase, IS4, partial [mine drainage metagenome]
MVRGTERPAEDHRPLRLLLPGRRPTPSSAVAGLARARKASGAYPTRSFNLDFHTIRHYGDPEVSRLEKDYVPATEPIGPGGGVGLRPEWEGREMVYARANLLKEEKADEVVRFVDYWKEVDGEPPEELVFDAHMTTHAGLAKLDRRGIKFLTRRERRSR